LKRSILLLVCLALLASSMTSAIAQGVAPNFTLTDIDGVKFSLGDQRGKIVLLDFFAIMCTGCVEEMPHLNAVHQEFGENVTIISIDTTPEVDTVNALQQFRHDNNITWIVARDTDGGVSANYTIQVEPTLVIIDKEGYIQYRHQDVTDESVLRQEISAIVPEFGIWPPVFILLTLTIVIAIFTRTKRRLLMNRDSL
jgi:peroxiredoxin